MSPHVQPLGSKCRHCGYRPARVRRNRYGDTRYATLYCSRACAVAEANQREQARALAAVNQLRALLGLPAGGHVLTSLEAEAVVRRLRRLVPPGGLSRMPAGRQSRKRVRSSTPTRRRTVSQEGAT